MERIRSGGQLALPCHVQILEKTNLKRARIYFGSEFQSFRSVFRLAGFRLIARPNTAEGAGGMMVES